ncbi:hypothetical protein [Euzebyella saccharophila]|uniref:EF-hand domain-containing protein n=1 Tax=Euzebyella saccharophila TaxID=679664 RepID=A0ABV8JTF9_9FLAO|nr:hypothetical protein [Euzebyella saccharophila]
MNTPSFIGFLLSILGIAALLFWGRNIQNPYWKCIWRSGLLFCSLYALILLILAMNAQYINLQMEAMDLDSNGKIDLTEYTPEYRELRNQLLKDPEKKQCVFKRCPFIFTNGRNRFRNGYLYHLPQV